MFSKPEIAGQELELFGMTNRRYILFRLDGVESYYSYFYKKSRDPYYLKLAKVALALREVLEAHLDWEFVFYPRDKDVIDKKINSLIISLVNSIMKRGLYSRYYPTYAETAMEDFYFRYGVKK